MPLKKARGQRLLGREDYYSFGRLRLSCERPGKDPDNDQPARNDLHQKALSGKLSEVIPGNHFFII
jgi:hypothetical protein